MKISIQPSALADLKEGFHFYEQQHSRLGSYFLDSLYADIDSLLLYAGIHSMHFGRFHRLLAIYYQIENEAVFVRAVLDLRRDPAWIKRRLESGPN